MLTITLPDGTQRTYEEATVTPGMVAASIGAGLAKAAIAAVVDGKLVDLSFPLTQNAQLRIITAKDTEGLEVLRHSCAHLMAQAVQALHPEAQVTIGPVIEDGFFYDFAYARPFTPEDLEAIEKKMHSIAEQNLAVSREVWEKDQAIKWFKEKGEHYKVEIIQGLPEGEPLSVYKQGDFLDLCRGPHIPHTGHLKAFKLLKVAGAYWRGDAKNAMLQRIYGTAWGTTGALADYLKRLEEAEKRDHRKIAKKLDLFHLQEDAPGMIFWHPNGWTVYRLIEQYMSARLEETDYVQVRTPQVMDRTLWEQSGHWEMFGKNMFTVRAQSGDESERNYVIKPMNCPCHVQIFNQGLKSYRDLPLRMAEFGSCHRYEPSGSLHGIMRTRQFVQDDAHIFCTEAQITDEASKFINLLQSVYQDFGFTELQIKLSTRPEQRLGSDELWDKAEGALAQALVSAGLSYDLQPGEGAFYGPKIEFSLKDCMGRVWQCGTLQLDYALPGRLGASYIDEAGQKQVPVMLHRAALGSLERFIGILIEETAGNFPLWLAPVQISVLNISDKQTEYVNYVTQELKKQGFRVIADLRNEKIGFKIREHTLNRVPFLLILGDKEMASHTVSIRTRQGKEQSGVTLENFVSHMIKCVAARGKKLELEESAIVD